MLKRPAVSLIVLAFASGCATQAPPYPAAAPPASARPAAARVPGPAFNPREARYILQHGTNAIDGRAMVRSGDGGVATCAGDSATLVPDTTYTRARLNRLYGGRRDYAEISTAPRLARDRQYETYVRHAPCDGEGRFRFDQIADGRYVVVAPVRLPAEGRGRGISLRQTVAVHGGETRSVVLSR